jgi:hypothetical protein
MKPQRGKMKIKAAKYIFEQEEKMNCKKELCTQEHLISKHIVNKSARKERKEGEGSAKKKNQIQETMYRGSLLERLIKETNMRW